MGEQMNRAFILNTIGILEYCYRGYIQLGEGIEANRVRKEIEIWRAELGL